MADEPDDSDDETEPAGAAVAETRPAVEPSAEVPVTSASISGPLDEEIVTVTNEPISGGPTIPVTRQSSKSEIRNPKSETSPESEIRNRKQVTECGVVMPVSYAELSENRPLSVTKAPISAPLDEAIVTVTNEPIAPGTVDRREEIVDAVRGSPRPSAGASHAFGDTKR
jgi:hypothetical protein